VHSADASLLNKRQKEVMEQGIDPEERIGEEGGSGWGCWRVLFALGGSLGV